jgi:RNA polymerase sigma factor (sigma-70 family)
VTTAIEQFAIQLGRSSQRARRHLGALSHHDRDDVLGEAILRCWEQRESFDATRRSVDDWFAEVVRDVRTSIKNHNHKRAARFKSVDRLRELASSEDTARVAESQQMFEQLHEELSDGEKTVVALLAEGRSVREAGRAAGVPSSVARRLHRRIRELGDRFSVGHDQGRTQRSVTLGSDSDFPREAAPIDHEIEKMLRRPTTERADCPVCWRCMWFEGLTPKNWKPPTNADEEVRCAVHATEIEKIRIAGG